MLIFRDGTLKVFELNKRMNDDGTIEGMVGLRDGSTRWLVSFVIEILPDGETKRMIWGCPNESVVEMARDVINQIKGVWP